MKKVILTTVLLAGFAGKAQLTVVDPANIAQSIANTSNELVQTSTTAQNMINNFQETIKIYEQGKQYYDALKSVHNLVKDAKKVQNTILLVGEISDLYVKNFQKMLSDPNFRVEELSAISYGYSVLLQESADMLLELQDVITVNGLSMNDHERMDIIDRVYSSIKRNRDLVSYFTRKNISVSYLRAKKKGDADSVIALYGNSDDRHW